MLKDGRFFASVLDCCTRWACPGSPSLLTTRHSNPHNPPRPPCRAPASAPAPRASTRHPGRASSRPRLPCPARRPRASEEEMGSQRRANGRAGGTRSVSGARSFAQVHRRAPMSTGRAVALREALKSLRKLMRMLGGPYAREDLWPDVHFAVEELSSGSRRDCSFFETDAQLSDPCVRPRKREMTPSPRATGHPQEDRVGTRAQAPSLQAQRHLWRHFPPCTEAQAGHRLGAPPAPRFDRPGGHERRRRKSALRGQADRLRPCRRRERALVWYLYGKGLGFQGERASDLSSEVAA